MNNKTAKNVVLWTTFGGHLGYLLRICSRKQKKIK